MQRLDVMKLAGLTSAGRTSLIARLVEGLLLIVVFAGHLQSSVGGWPRSSHSRFFQVLTRIMQPRTVRAPTTEGFRTELAFLVKGERGLGPIYRQPT